MARLGVRLLRSGCALLALACDRGDPLALPIEPSSEPSEPSRVPEPAPPAPVCGDGVVEGTELCDDGNLSPVDGCWECEIQPGFRCPSPGGPCEVIPGCGNSSIEPPESCDDGNTTAGDGCSSECRVEPWWQCPAPGFPCVQVSVCGDAHFGPDEQCDDGNAESGDGCSQTCRLELGYLCSLVGEPCRPVCGDGLMQDAEACDDGNAQNGDGCNARCRVEPYWTCDGAGTCSPARCGDGMQEAGEACDDGNVTAGDGCSPTCVLEPQCADGGCVALCGDGLLTAEEACDDANRFGGDGCDENCGIEPGFGCEPGPCGIVPGAAGTVDAGSSPDAGTTAVPVAQCSVCSGVCGDGIEVLLEECDEGEQNGVDYAGCSRECTRTSYCGDGVIDPNIEECDNGRNVDLYHLCPESGELHIEGGVEPCTPSCAAGCVYPGYCGDGILQAGFEACDLGFEQNIGGYEGCNADCTRGPRCGDGVVQEEYGESCETGYRGRVFGTILLPMCIRCRY